MLKAAHIGVQRHAGHCSSDNSRRGGRGRTCHTLGRPDLGRGSCSRWWHGLAAPLEDLIPMAASHLSVYLKKTEHTGGWGREELGDEGGERNGVMGSTREARHGCGELLGRWGQPDGLRRRGFDDTAVASFLGQDLGDEVVLCLGWTTAWSGTSSHGSWSRGGARDRGSLVQRVSRREEWGRRVWLKTGAGRARGASRLRRARARWWHRSMGIAMVGVKIN